MKLEPFIFALALAPLALTGTPSLASEGHAHWSYRGHGGPSHWGKLEEEFTTCRTGQEQSPIDIRTNKLVASAKLPAIAPAYRQSAAELVNNGHTIQINLAAGGSAALSNGEYKLLQFHFHTPSEEAINGTRYSLVAHLVHKNDAGKLAVVSVLFKRGAENPALKELFARLPAEEGKTPLPDGFDAAVLLPKFLTYYAFQGSLTTPPCSEGVSWHVLKQPLEASPGQIAAFRKVFPMNARPLQARHARKVVEVN